MEATAIRSVWTMLNESLTEEAINLLKEVGVDDYIESYAAAVERGQMQV